MSLANRMNVPLRPILTLLGLFSILQHAVAFAATPAQRRCVRNYEKAQEHSIRGDLLQAQELLSECVATRCGRVLKRECRAALQDVRDELPSVVLSFRTDAGDKLSNVRVEMDDAPLATSLDGEAVEVNPGFHTFSFYTEAGRRYNRLLTVRRGDKALPVVLQEQVPAEVKQRKAEEAELKVVDTPPATEPPSPSDAGTNWLPYIVGGASVVVGVGGYVGLRMLAGAKYAELPACYPDCSADQVTGVRDLYTAANVSLAVGAAGLGVGALLWWLDQGERPAPQSPSSLAATPFVTPVEGGALTGVTGTF